MIKEYKSSQAGGQIRRDIERLSELGSINIGNIANDIVFSPTKTKFIGVVPAGLRPRLMTSIRAQLTAENLSFEIIAADVTSGELDTAATQLQNLARDFANAPVPPPGLPPTPSP